jgi:hypothetical protein
MFIDSPDKVNDGSSGAECCYGGTDTSRSAGARAEGGAAAINIWFLRDRSNVRATHYYPTTRNQGGGRPSRAAAVGLSDVMAARFLCILTS